jgi:pyrroloquinoline quinone (PQQ) biosynthesis protein C
MANDTISIAQSLVHTIRGVLHDVEQQIRRHAYLHALEEGSIAPARLRCFVGEQCHIIPGDLRSIALLISRCEQPAGQQFFRDVLQGEAAALGALEPLATAVGMSPADCAAYEPAPGAQAYSGYLAYLCLYGADAEVAAALSVNFAAWGANCGRMAQALRQHYGMQEADLRFFTQFAAAPHDVSSQALALITAGLQRGVEARRIVRAARMLQGYELLFWDTVYTLSTAAAA